MPEPHSDSTMTQPRIAAQALLDVNAKKRFDAGYWRGILDAQGKVDGGYY